MDQNLKIVIKAVTDSAEKSLKKVSKAVEDVGAKSKASGSKFSAAMKAMGKGAAVGAAIAVTAIGAVITALVSLGKSTKEYREEQAKLNAAFLAAGSTTEQAAQSYTNLYRFLGDSQKATEAAGHLAKLTTNEKSLAEWTTALQGVYATFGDSLPIEGLTEAANETARVGKVTGTMADALNWAGVSEDAFNAQLAATSSLEEREALIRGTLNGLYGDAAAIYEQVNADVIAQNEAQARLNATTGRLGKTITPLITALTNLANIVLTALEPAITFIVGVLTKFINIVARAVQWVSNLIGALGGSKAKDNAQQLASSIGGVTGGLEGASSGTNKLSDGLADATDQAEKLKRTTAGFDELNIMSSGSAAASSTSGDSYADTIGGDDVPLGDLTLGSGLTDSFDKVSEKASKFAEKITKVFNNLKNKVKEWVGLFTPSFDAWKEAFSGLGGPISETFSSIKGSFGNLWNDTLKPFSENILNDFIPDITNSFSENFAPIFGDLTEMLLPELAKDFEWMCQQINNAVNDIVAPAMESFKKITTDSMDIVGKEWEENGKTLTEKFIGFKESIKGIWESLYGKILKPVWDKILGAINSIWEEHLKGLVERILSFCSKVGNAVMTVWNNVLAPIVKWIIDVLAPIIVGAIDSILSVIKTIIGIITDVVKGILKSLGGLMDFITGVFSGNWKLAWQGFQDIFKGIWDAIWGICKGVVNLIIDGINGLWTGIYNTIRGLVNGVGKIAGAIGNMLGKDWSFEMPKEPKKIPKLATGGITNGATLAMIGERGREAVLPLENNTGWMDQLADRIAARQTSPSKIVLQVGEKELGWAAINSINDITKQTGGLQLHIV